uniref:Uncharacterized protein n=1 Tax=Oryza glumipatula TaxID=40148 RepID=A0A0E0ADK0_9ORYZ
MEGVLEVHPIGGVFNGAATTYFLHMALPSGDAATALEMTYTSSRLLPLRFRPVSCRLTTSGP